MFRNGIKNKTLLRGFAYTCIFLLLLLLIYNIFNVLSKNTTISIKIFQDTETEYQVFYTLSNKTTFLEEFSKKIIVKENRQFTNLKFIIDNNNLKSVRVDLGYKQNANFLINEVTVKSGPYKITYNAEQLFKNINIGSDMHDIEISGIKDSSLSIITLGNDPFLIIKDINIAKSNIYSTMIISAVLSLIVTFILYRFVKLKVIYNLFMDLYINKKLIFSLSVNDFKTKYAGSYFGAVWAFVQPICTIFMFWFVFQVGFRSSSVENVPFVLWLACGLIPWFFFADAWASATNSFLDYSYLVKKVVFKINILPIVKVLSSLFVHIVFILFLFLIFGLYKIYPNLYMMQIIYYIICVFVLVIGLSLITSSLIIFFKDLGQIMNIILQFGMWLTPIMWQTSMIPDRFVWIIKLNPMYYIVQGYRDTMIGNILFYQNIKQMIYFWGVTLLIFLIGSILFTKLKPHFADVL